MRPGRRGLAEERGKGCQATQDKSSECSSFPPYSPAQPIASGGTCRVEMSESTGPAVTTGMEGRFQPRPAWMLHVFPALVP